jgi:4-hydroxybenzoate polyprenyltransferase
VGYKVKRGSTPTESSIKEMLLSFIRRLVVVVIIMAVMVAIGYFLFQFAYDAFPAFAIAADDVVFFVRGFYAEHGIWATLGMLGFICLAVWAFGEEAKRKDRRKQAMNEMMK